MIKQTQTKMFRFSDVGLDLCSGSKNKFPEVFKKVLATGFNTQNASSVSISGNQITLNYGISHGYVADRILQVTASGGFDQQVYIDSVTSNSVTCTVLTGNTTGLSGSISTKVASLGWEIVYEVGNIHIYRFKHIDDTDMYARFCFQDNSSGRNCLVPCVGKTADLTNGTITDEYAETANKSILTPTDVASVKRWEFSGIAASTYDNYTYSQGSSFFGNGLFIGSPYHFCVSLHHYSADGRGVINAILPCAMHNYLTIQRPLLLMYDLNSTGNTNITSYIPSLEISVGGYACSIEKQNTGNAKLVAPTAASSFLGLDTFNTTTVESISIYENATKQHLGYVIGGMYIARYGSTNTPPISRTDSPSFTTDIDFSNNIALHYIGNQGSAAASVFFALPVEEVKIGA